MKKKLLKLFIALCLSFCFLPKNTVSAQDFQVGQSLLQSIEDLIVASII